MCVSMEHRPSCISSLLLGGWGSQTRILKQVKFSGCAQTQVSFYSNENNNTTTGDDDGDNDNDDNVSSGDKNFTSL